MTFRRHMEKAALRALADFPAERTSDIYTITFRIDSVDQDPRFPYLAIGYSTETDVALRSAELGPSGEWDARWNYPYFPASALDGIAIAGHDPERDPVGAALHRREAETRGLWYDDDAELRADDRATRLDEEFHELSVDLARGLHADGRIVERLGRPMPVILYDMFDPDAMFALTRAANPPELVADFLAGDEEPAEHRDT